MKLLMQLELTLYATNYLYVESPGYIPVARGRLPLHDGITSCGTSLDVLIGPACDLYQVDLSDLCALPEPGWASGRASLSVNAHGLGMQPIAFFAEDPTDWPTGLVSWSGPPREVGQRAVRVGVVGDHLATRTAVSTVPLIVPGTTWQLAVRRA